ncbi:MAG: hypothetical protein WCZ99_01725 [Candidatus Paceibacterota bacterium]|nr:hypothetical protein [Candidatus Paceibacterota bacterium]MDD3072705.1 hypothetical protein [Candidatus Paceibacterota bacterium]MDD3729366.1 hypothetical protein [Candidatus Paceibacterota bacterium]MDD4201789.1 hypothetical protein [Candidatus Paceibacterota bacterium]MDD4897636.1 hypothetical protein [Candidatus Paceibacterota bacterium]
MNTTKSKEKEIEMSRTIFLFLVPAFIVAITIISSFFIGWWALSFLILLLLFFYNSIVMIQVDPPHKGVLVFLGQRQEEILNEGWRFVPLNPVIFNVFLVKILATRQTISIQIYSSDNVKHIIEISITWTPCYDPPLLINFLNSGGEKGVKKEIESIIHGNITSWSRSFNYKKLGDAGNSAISSILKIICGNEVGDKEVRNVIQGKGCIIHEGLGVKINQINITGLRFVGEFAKVAELSVVKGIKIDIEKKELKQIADFIKKYKEEGNLSTSEAIELIQTEKGTVSKKIKEVSISPKIIEVLADPKIVDAINKILGK